MEAFARIITSQGELELTPENTALYIHIGRYALFNHLFIKVDEQSGFYLWCHENGYDELSESGVEAEIPLHVNLQQVNPNDEAQYMKEATHDLYASDSFPESWSEND